MLGQPLAQLLGADEVQRLRAEILPHDLAATPQYLPAIELGTPGQIFERIIHRNQGQLMLEFEPRPALILLDLNLPGTDGREVLARIKGDEALKTIPVIIVTTSANPLDVLPCYAQGANGYHIKSVNYPAFKRELQHLIRYWLTDCLIPARLEEKP